MRLSFLGAAGEVTGSGYLVESDRGSVLVDYGMIQGSRDAERRNAVVPGALASRPPRAIVLTHAHLDHCGRLPLLVRTGWRGAIHATPATCDLAEIILRDAAKIQEEDAERDSRRSRRRGGGPVEPLYTAEDAEATIGMFSPLPYGEEREVAPGVSARFTDAGHILGSASVRMRIAADGRERVIAFSGDIGPRGLPLLRDPEPPERVDLVVMESTYGDRDHRPLAATVDELAELLGRARQAGGRVLVPAFAVGRTQQLIYHLGELERAGRLRGERVFVDSPMAFTTTQLYRRSRALFDDDAWRLIEAGRSPLDFPRLAFTRSRAESVALNDADGGVIIIAASGMCTGGRILHHLKHGLWRPETHVVICGYQSEGSLGRELVEGARMVRIMGEEIAVQATIHTLGGLSAHAGQTELVDWLEKVASTCGSPPRVYLTHGEARGREPLRVKIRQRLGIEAGLPTNGEAVEL